MNASEQRQAFAALVRQHQPARSPKVQALTPFQEAIAEARKKGASYETIRIYLGKTAVDVSADTVARFCHQVLGEPVNHPPNRRKAPAARRNGSPVPKAPVKRRSNAQSTKDYQPTSGPRIVDPKAL